MVKGSYQRGITSLAHTFFRPKVDSIGPQIE